MLYTAFTSGTFCTHVSILRALRSLAGKKPVYILFIHGIGKLMGSWPIYEGIEKSLEIEQDEEECVDGFSFQGRKEMPLGENN